MDTQEERSGQVLFFFFPKVALARRQGVEYSLYRLNVMWRRVGFDCGLR